MCAARGCALTITRSYDGPAFRLTAPLVHHADGWHARFPPIRFQCFDDKSAYAPMRSQWVLRFRDGGRTLEARERIFIFDRGCQYRNALVEWSATRPAPPPAPPPPGAPPRPALPTDPV